MDNYKLHNAGTHTTGDILNRDDWNFAGIADAHGIESFYPRDKIDSRRLFQWSVRAEANRHRHAVMYFALLNTKVQEEVDKALEDEQESKALNIIKRKCKQVLMTNQNSWQLIPNKNLDPYANS
tara:strand:- start:24 stop:395 length:372 start_codon:yes stop_codon:yes gene_type:complete